MIYRMLGKRGRNAREGRRYHIHESFVSYDFTVLCNWSVYVSVCMRERGGGRERRERERRESEGASKQASEQASERASERERERFDVDVSELARVHLRACGGAPTYTQMRAPVWGRHMRLCVDRVLVTEDFRADARAEGAKRACVQGSTQNSRHEAGTCWWGAWGAASSPLLPSKGDEDMNQQASCGPQRREPSSSSVCSNSRDRTVSQQTCVRRGL